MKLSKNKIYAAAATTGIMGMIRTDAEPKLWQAALVTLGFYWIVLTAIRIVRSEFRENRVKDGKFRLVKPWWEELIGDENGMDTHR